MMYGWEDTSCSRRRGGHWHPAILKGRGESRGSGGDTYRERERKRKIKRKRESVGGWAQTRRSKY